MNRTTSLCLLTAFIVGWFVYGLCVIGDTSSMKPGETFGWGVPFSLLILTGVPALLGYFIGSSEN